MTMTEPELTTGDPAAQRALLDSLLEKRQRAWTQCEEIMGRADKDSGKLSAEDDTAYTKARDDVLDLTQSTDRLRDHLGLSGPFNKVSRETIPVGGEGQRGDGDGQPGPTENPEYRAAFTQYLRFGAERITAEHRSVLDQVRANLPQASGADNLGGYLVPKELSDQIIETAHTYSSLIEAGATVINTDSGNQIQYPTSDDTEEGEIIAENQAATGQEIEFGMVPIGAYIFSSKMVKIPRSLLADSGLDLEAFTRKRLGKRIGRRQARAYAAGTGIAEPQGILVAAPVGVTTVAVNAITYDELVTLRYTPDEAYDDDSSWLFARTTLAAMMKLKDNDGRPLFNWSPVADQPDTILGKPFRTNSFYPAIAAAAKVATYGDHSGYLVREVGQVMIQRLVERYAEFNQDAFIGWHRADGALTDLGSVRSLRMAAA